MRSQELEAVSLNMLRTIKGYSDKCKWLIKYKANVVLLHEDIACYEVEDNLHN